MEGKVDFHSLGLQDAKEIDNDHLQTDEEYVIFTMDWIEAVKPHLAPKNSVYIFIGDTMMCALREGMKQTGLYYSQTLIWIKNTIVVGRRDYLPQHEAIAYGWYGRHDMHRAKAKSVIMHPKPNKSKLHPIMKPPGLLRKMMPNNTRVGEYVYDPFGGSGSTLVAADHLKRRCTMIEMDPRYVQTIIKRWEKLHPGTKAKQL